MFKGYIEGYYSRRLPIDAFKDLKAPISHYFYGPKEDIYLRHRWQELDKNLKRISKIPKIKERISFIKDNAPKFLKSFLT